MLLTCAAVPAETLWPLLAASVVLGLASVPHCAAMCGALAAATCTGPRPGVAYGLGRLVGYGAAGAVAGLFGDVIAGSFSEPFVAAGLSWLIALSLGFTAWSLWSRRGATLVRLGRGARRSGAGARWWTTSFLRRPGLVGAMSALLPCGALASALALAAGASSPAGGSAVMILFACATLPGPVGVAFVGARLRGARRPWIERSLAVALMVGAVLFAVRPLSVLEGQAPDCCDAPIAHARG